MVDGEAIETRHNVILTFAVSDDKLFLTDIDTSEYEEPPDQLAHLSTVKQARRLVEWLKAQAVAEEALREEPEFAPGQTKPLPAAPALGSHEKPAEVDRKGWHTLAIALVGVGVLAATLLMLYRKRKG